MTYTITNTSNNPLKEDPELRRLLQELDAIDSKKEFRRWRHSFLKQLAGYVDEAHVKPAENKYQEFTHSMGRMSSLVKKLYGHLEVGDLSEDRTTVRARKCLSDLQQSMEHVNNHMFGMLPKTADQEKELGYSKFHLGAVLVRDGFVEYDRLVVCDEILQHMAANGLQHLADRQILDNMDHYHNRLGMFCDVMADLGLYKVMLKCRELLKKDDDDDDAEEEEDDDNDNATFNRDETLPKEETQISLPVCDEEKPASTFRAMRRASTGAMPSPTKMLSSPTKITVSPTRPSNKFTVTMNEPQMSRRREAPSKGATTATIDAPVIPTKAFNSFGNYYHGNNDWMIAATLKKEKKDKESRRNEKAETPMISPKNNERRGGQGRQHHGRTSNDKDKVGMVDVGHRNISTATDRNAKDDSTRLDLSSSDSESETDSGSDSESYSSESNSVDLSVVSKEWEPVLGRVGPDGCPKAYKGLLDESLNKSGHGASPSHRRRGGRKNVTNLANYIEDTTGKVKGETNRKPVERSTVKTSPTETTVAKLGTFPRDDIAANKCPNQAKERESGGTGADTPISTSQMDPVHNMTPESPMKATPKGTNDNNPPKSGAIGDPVDENIRSLVEKPKKPVRDSICKSSLNKDAPEGDVDGRSIGSPCTAASVPRKEDALVASSNKDCKKSQHDDVSDKALSSAAPCMTEHKSVDAMSEPRDTSGYGEAPENSVLFGEENFGYSVALSSDGTIIAAGSPNYGKRSEGRVRVFYWEEEDDDWALLGQTIFGKIPGDNLGVSVALSHDGRVLAVGSPQLTQRERSGCVRVYVYREENNYWDPMGSVIDGKVAGECFGWSVSLSGNGQRLVVGGPKNDNHIGAVRIFQYDSGNRTWKQLGRDAKGDRMGGSVATSADGRLAASGCGKKGDVKNANIFECN